MLFFNNKPFFSKDTVLKHADWFNEECHSARESYMQALRIFNSDQNSANRVLLIERKSSYKKIVRKCKNASYKQKMKEIEGLKRCKPKEFWKYFKSKQKPDYAGISIDAFKEHFANLSNDLSNCYNEDAEYFCTHHDFNNLSTCNTEFDQPITVSEIHSAVKSLKRNKAPGNDQLLNEYFVECIDILASHLCDLFNGILNSGYYPESWMEGLIIPLHKKGHKDDVNNYRGITLVSCLSKLFTTVLNKRIENFCSDNNSISDAQFGFRKRRSTVDPIFILHSLVQKYLNQNTRLYVIYVDMMKCFDSIYRNALWLKMFKTGIDGKLLRIVKDMYQKVKSCVKL